MRRKQDAYLKEYNCQWETIDETIKNILNRLVIKMQMLGNFNREIKPQWKQHMKIRELKNTIHKIKKKFKVASHRQISRIINCELKKGNII